MATLDPPFVNASLVALAICTWLFSRWISARRLKLPPGPRPDPFLGNIRQLSFDNQELRFTEWGAAFGIYPPYTCRHTLSYCDRRRCILSRLWPLDGRTEYLESCPRPHGKA